MINLDNVSYDPPAVRPLPYLEYYNEQFDKLVFINFYRPRIVCLCGSTKFNEAYQAANLRETLAGHIVLTIGCDMKADSDLFADNSQELNAAIKEQLDELHFHKIMLADEILVLNVGGYIGESTAREILEAHRLHKPVRYLDNRTPTIPWLYAKAGKETGQNGQTSNSG